MTTRDILIQARELISKPENWAKSFGEINDTRACALVALSRVTTGIEFHEAEKRLRKTAISLLGNKYDLKSMWSPAVQYNDMSKHEEVLKMFDLAIGDI